MRAPDVHVEIEVISPAPVEAIELAAIDLAAYRVATAMDGNEVIRFVPTLQRPGEQRATLAASPAMMIAVGDARGVESLPGFSDLRRPGVLSIAVMAVHAAGGAAALALARGFDAFLAVEVPALLESEGALASALRAVTASVTADISVPVDEVYPFFDGGGELTWGAAEGDNVRELMDRAVLAAGRRRGIQGGRALLHIETTQADFKSDLASALSVIDGTMNHDDVLWSVSTTRKQPKGASILIAPRPRRNARPRPARR